MVNLTRIYTKTGDDGTTSLGDMSRTSKNDPRLEAYATVDEANSAIGVVLALGGLKDDEIIKLLVRIQNDLFDVGADLCTPIVDNPSYRTVKSFRITN
jgi:cob(I)alamin adenosyltransferase